MVLTQKWLKTIAIIHIIGGLLLPVLVFTPIASSYFDHLLATFPEGDLTSMKFLIGIFGPTVASWGLLFYYSIGKAFQSKTPKDWWFLVSSIILWGALDSLLSVSFGVWFHLYLNGTIILLLLSPLIIEKHSFKESASDGSQRKA